MFTGRITIVMTINLCKFDIEVKMTWKKVNLWKFKGNMWTWTETIELMNKKKLRNVTN